ncbi:carbohydrate sulfotransferase 1 [Denticeps clupeoides]|uniref:Sulfotransferase n=1 Tax=Denticeps clupeoides TaxID=299321 RepID=A0AAY4BP54_9TELE|nr:carbohydrate sulfotransferase 1-like [Denticeps clupeoides]XP_028814174.1 carbohydrate sulfotransferase 1-like [Denticeps clupeoides]XP_028814175.1 carbohydrate sulfotransferase 1-like [Denticeps clupeoides]XP_028814176.1 carbohydrate sulfotransferase 1-like [Denticeps clupeoides]XP_028814177.1 carbohydrate sulfotransferase 1-like [Denticeps clupeoides]
MECSWKMVLLLVCASLGVQYTAIRSLRDSFPASCQGSSTCQTRQPKESRWRSPCDESLFPVETTTSLTRRHILLFATTRSGSSFTGQLLNQHPGIFYVFEPLYHVQQAFTNSSSRLQRTLDRRALLGAYRDLLLNLYTCDLSFLENYIRPEPQDHLTGSFFRRSSSHALCSPPVCQEGSEETLEGQPDETWCPKKCRALNLTLASLACQERGHVAIKTVRIPEVGDLRTLTEDPRLDLKIIHLVRDPRAILSSRMTAFADQFRAWRIWNATGRQPRYVDLTQITRTCRDMEESTETGLQRPAWLRGHYLLVRYEDLALNPEKKTREIYQFLGLDLDHRVLTWIAQNTNVSTPSSSSEWNYKYSTARDSRATAESWRHHLGFDIVRTVQNLCNSTLSLLGYRPAQSVNDLRNLSKSLVEPRGFHPVR